LNNFTVTDKTAKSPAVYKIIGESTECTITPVYKEKELMEERV
jgi:hypothetical protein